MKRRVLVDTEEFLLPDRCSRCLFVRITQYNPECSLTGYNVNTEFEFATRHEYCPLKEVEYNEDNNL